MSAGGAAGRREVAARVFAAEYDDADLEYSESDEERAPNYVLTPTGARVNRLFVVGVLTEVESVSDDVLRGRIVDPTGAFVVYAGQYQPDAKTALERTEPPAFVAVTGKARTFRPDDGDRVYTSIRPESVNAVDAETRDRWTVQAAEHTVERVATFAAASERAERGDALREVLLESGVGAGLAAGIPRAIDHYGTTEEYLAAVRGLAVQAAEVVAGEREEVEPLGLSPEEGGAVEADLTGGVAIEAGPAEDVVETDEEVTAPESAAAEAPGPEPAEGTDRVEEAGEDPGDFDDFVDEEVAPATADADRAAGDGADGADAAETDELYELDEEERAAVEAEYGTEFETGGEVDAPGEADIETPGTDEVEGSATEEASEATDADGAVEAGEPDEPEDGAGGDPTEAGDLVDAVVAAMDELDEGDGADRAAVVERVAADRGVDGARVEDAIQDALMAGRCYEPDDGRLTAI